MASGSTLSLWRATLSIKRALGKDWPLAIRRLHHSAWLGYRPLHLQTLLLSLDTYQLKGQRGSSTLALLQLFLAQHSFLLSQLWPSLASTVPLRLPLPKVTGDYPMDKSKRHFLGFYLTSSKNIWLVDLSSLVSLMLPLVFLPPSLYPLCSCLSRCHLV